jgi:hypothetical protein
MNNAREITEALSGRLSGTSGMARCPAHDDHNPSLSITERDGQLLVHCHAGCPQEAVWAALTRMGLVGGDDTRDAIQTRLCGNPGAMQTPIKT